MVKGYLFAGFTGFIDSYHEIISPSHFPGLYTNILTPLQTMINIKCKVAVLECSLCSKANLMQKSAIHS